MILAMERQKMKRKIYIVGETGGHYANWMEGTIVPTMESADLVVFTGGEDVDPSMYGEPQNPKTYSNLERDIFERNAWLKAVSLGKRIIGICRGSQFACVMSGGRLVQHQENQRFYHNINTYDGKTLEITSTHHQAQYPWNLPEEEYSILGWTQGMSRMHEDGEGRELPEAANKECEIVYYKKTRALGIQGHPEMMFDPSHPTIQWLRELLDKHMEDTIIAEEAEVATA